MLACTFEDFRAQATVTEAARVEIGEGHAPAVRDAVTAEAIAGRAGADALMTAALKTLTDHAPQLLDARDGFRLTVATDIPRQAGLAGSSAIVVAALRGLAAFFDLRLDAGTLARLALVAETEVLGITAGPMDRVVQAHEGLLFMDFRPGGSHTRLDAGLLPPLFVAWDPTPGEDSGVVHDRVRPRWERGEPLVVETVEELASLADAGVEALRQGDAASFGRAVERSFAVRAGVWTPSARDREMVDLARRVGVAAKPCGSGGAIVGVLPAARAFPALAEAYRRAGFRALCPRVGP